MNRNLAVDALKCCLAIMVVGLHTNLFHGLSGGLNSIAVNGAFRVAVPIFFVLAGYYFYSINTLQKFKSWAKRLIILYAFWMVVYVPFYYPTFDMFTMLNSTPLLATLAFGFFHLWYVIGMLMGGALLWLIRDWRAKPLLLVAGVLYVLGVAIQYTQHYLVPAIPLYAYRNFLFFALPMMAIGLAMKKNDFSGVATKTLCLGLAAGLVLLMTEVLLARKYWGGFDMYLSLIVICPILFALALRVNIQGHFPGLAIMSSVIYFSHAFFMLVLVQVVGMPNGPGLFFATVAASLALYALVIRHRQRLHWIF